MAKKNLNQLKLIILEKGVFENMYPWKLYHFESSARKILENGVFFPNITIQGSIKVGAW